MEKHWDELYDRVNKTTKARFNACRRLKKRDAIFLGSISVASLALALMPLLEVYEIVGWLKSNGGIFSLFQILFSVIILLLSIVISMSDYSMRSEKFHMCGIDLNILLRQIALEKDVDVNNYTKYLELLDKYNIILRQYENHAPEDHKSVKNDNELRKYPLSCVIYKLLMGFIAVVIIITIRCFI